MVPLLWDLLEFWELGCHAVTVLTACLRTGRACPCSRSGGMFVCNLLVVHCIVVSCLRSPQSCDLCFIARRSASKGHWKRTLGPSSPRCHGHKPPEIFFQRSKQTKRIPIRKCARSMLPVEGLWELRLDFVISPPLSSSSAAATSRRTNFML